MDYTAIILEAAKNVGVAGNLLLAICSYESNHFKLNYNKHDPSYGICQVKKSTARMFGFKGKTKDILDPEINALYAAKYLAYQADRYHGNWVEMTGAYNSGTYNASPVVLGCPRNLDYLRRVQKELSDEDKPKLNCGYKKKKKKNK